MEIEYDYPLRDLNTFGIAATAKAYARISSLDDWAALMQTPEYKQGPVLILGGGSNMLLVNDYPGLVAQVDLLGKEVISETEDEVVVAAGAGENWHAWVLFCVENGWGGIENLSLIPGRVGAAPIQNIGAYGVEIKDVFEYLEAVHLKTGDPVTFRLQQCHFGYRDSIFKRALRGEYLITKVAFRLSKKPVLNTGYGAIEQELAAIPAEKRTIQDVSQAVIRIRQSKLPDPAVIGNAGSFFKNPEIPTAQFEALLLQFPGIVGYPVSETITKVPAGWLIEQAGWKGKRFGEYGVHANQALVLVNYGNARGADIYQLSTDILQSVKGKFGIDLEREVNVI